jgi:hypothetical protein
MNRKRKFFVENLLSILFIGFEMLILEDKMGKRGDIKTLKHIPFILPFRYFYVQSSNFLIIKNGTLDDLFFN